MYQAPRWFAVGLLGVAEVLELLARVASSPRPCPISPVGSGCASSSPTMTWSAGYGLPTVPGLREPGRRRRRACPRPRSTRSTRRAPGPSHSIIARFTGTGHGAAPCTTSRSDERSWRAARLVVEREQAVEHRRHHVGVRHAVLLDELQRLVRGPAVHQHDARTVRERADQRDVQRRGVVQRAGAEVDAVGLVARDVLDRGRAAAACAHPSAGRSCPTCRASGVPGVGSASGSDGSRDERGVVGLADRRACRRRRARVEASAMSVARARRPARRSASTTSARASQSLTMYDISSTVRCQLIGVRRKPARRHAAQISTNSGRFRQIERDGVAGREAPGAQHAARAGPHGRRARRRCGRRTATRWPSGPARSRAQ